MTLKALQESRQELAQEIYLKRCLEDTCQSQHKQIKALEAALREARDDLTEESTSSHDKIYEALQTIYKVLK